MAHLSDIELYFSPVKVLDKIITISGDEFHHAINVMRRSVEEPIYITDGIGNFYSCLIKTISKNELIAEIISINHFENENRNIHFCIPLLKNPDRMKFAIEKSVELGVTSFLLFSSKRTIAKSANLNRLNSVALSAMKQSLRTYLPVIKEIKLESVFKLNGIKIILDQTAESELRFTNDHSNDYYFLFGPEGGLEIEEIKELKADKIFSLGKNRLRTETAIVKCASIILNA
ncbi:MAG TPA: RsmE family RNA methyltransferase [Ignavibacteriaceae bacterium]